jgi:hypothetical protein
LVLPCTRIHDSFIFTRTPTRRLSANGNEHQFTGVKAEDGFNLSFAVPQLLGDCPTGRNDQRCSILNNRQQKSYKFCLLKYGKDE